MCPYYAVWVHMLERCYGKKYQEKHHTYKGCTVCKEWLIFSMFKKWMELQDWFEKQLDKDIMFPGNKIYSPEMCNFATNQINKLLTDSKATRGK